MPWRGLPIARGGAAAGDGGWAGRLGWARACRCAQPQRRLAFPGAKPARCMRNQLWGAIGSPVKIRVPPASTERAAGAKVAPTVAAVLTRGAACAAGATASSSARAPSIAPCRRCIRDDACAACTSLAPSLWRRERRQWGRATVQRGSPLVDGALPTCSMPHSRYQAGAGPAAPHKRDPAAAGQSGSPGSSPTLQ